METIESVQNTRKAGSIQFRCVRSKLVCHRIQANVNIAISLLLLPLFDLLNIVVFQDSNKTE